KDVTKPVKPVLADVSGECSATVTAPTTTDNCSGTITGTTSDALTYTTQGTHIITWTFTDAAGNVETATQNVMVKDLTKPVKPVLADVSGECSATVTAPTTTDNCSGTLTGTTSDALTYTTQGTHIITWTFTDAAGNIETATQNVIVKDVTKPVKPVLADITGECSATAMAPTTTDNCSGTLTGTTSDALTYTTQGTHIITWTFTDAAGNIETTTQNVMVKDVTKPVKPVLADVTGECSATVTAPTTTDNCSGTLTGTTSDALTYTTQGTHIITWTFTDAAGNIETATQNVIVKDVTKPVKPVLADITGECSATAMAPTTTDNCSGTLTGTTSDALTYTTQGTHIITWTFTDAAGNIETATQKVILTNIKAPIVTIVSQPTCATATGSILISASAGVTYSVDGGAYSANTSYILTSGDHVVRAKSTGGCISEFTSVIINAQPAAPSATISYGQTEYQATGTANVIHTGQAGGTYSASPSGLSINAATGAINLGSSTPNQTYMITYNFSNGSCSGSTTTSVKINSVPATISYGKPAFCATGIVSVTRTGPTGGVYTSNNTGLKINSSTGEINLTSSTPGNYVVTYEYKNGSITANTTTTITINAMPVIGITSNLGLEISKGDIATLTASGGTSYTWTGTDIQSGQNTAILTVRPKTTTTYTVIATNANGCSDAMQITIKVKEDLKLIPNNVITPNGDGKNDTWVIKNIDYYPNNKVGIYDRAGRLVYSKKGYTNDWDGTLNGNPLSEDAYIYVIDMGTGVGLIRGTVSIIRDYK
ncbi:gliding motility-associated C-terminal domain-containing protein, partial [Pedobacter punctiformis]